MSKKSFSLSIAVSLVVLLLLVGCSQQETEKKPQQVTVEAEKYTQQETTEGEQKENSEDTKTVICPSGEEVMVPSADKINRVVMTSVPLPSAYRLIEDDLSKLVGIHPGSKDDATNSILGKMAPEIRDIPSDFMKGSEVNIEELLKLKPDLVFYYGGFKKQADTYKNAGITAIDTKPLKRGNALDIMVSWVKVLGEVFENENNISDIVDYGMAIMHEIKDQTANIQDDKKAKALVIFRISEKNITVSGEGNQGDNWLALTGAKNVAENIKGTSSADMEQIYAWNPEVIYIFNDAMPEDLMNNTISGQDWRNVKAVQTGRVYKIPVGIARWFPPSGDAPLMMKWMAKHNYPELFKHYNMEKEIKEYYKKYYKYDISDEDIHTILNPTREESMIRGKGTNY